MPRISLTDFVDIVSSSGVPKATKIAQIKARPEYQPQFDFYKALRESIQKLHQTNSKKADLDKILLSLNDKKKIENYPAAIKGYKKWLGNKSTKWFSPPKDDLSKLGIQVSVNPELGLEIDGVRYVIKLYFKGDKLSKPRVDLITNTMEDTLRPLSQPDDIMAVLDVRRAKLFEGAGPSNKHSAIVIAELSYVASLWDAL